MTTSILILTHNAPKYTEETITTLNEITDAATRAECEVIVLDNSSDEPTKRIISNLHNKGYIDKLEFSEENNFFSRGNNIAARMADTSSRYLLLLNSDIRINDPEWLRKLIEHKERGGYAAAAYGYCPRPDRADGYCLLIDKSLYIRHMMDENFPWWGGATKLQYELLREGFDILAIDNHDDVIYHYGGKSGTDFKKAGRLDSAYDELMANFGNVTGRVSVKNIDRRPHPVRYIKTKLKKIFSAIKRL